jgi:hypothetical protein
MTIDEKSSRRKVRFEDTAYDFTDLLAHPP